MSITVTIGANGRIRDCLFDDEDHGTKASDLTLGDSAEFIDSQWIAGNASSTITLGASAIVDGSSLEIDNNLVMSGARSVIRGSRVTFAAGGDADLSGEGAQIVDTQVFTYQTSGTEAILLSGNNTKVDVLARIGTTQTTDIYDVVRVTGDHAQIDLSLVTEGARKWRFAVTIDAGALGTRLDRIAVDDVGILSDGVVNDSGSDTIRTDNAFFNGTFLETFSAAVTEAAGTVTMSLEKSGGGQLTMVFSDGHTQLDTAPALTIALTTGSDTSPTTNYIYIPQSTKVLTKSTSGFPTATEHIKLALFLVPSAAFVAAHGVYVQQNWTDHAADLSGQGHLADLSERIRRTQAAWFSGLAGAGTSDYLTIVGGTIDLKIASGVVYQMHRHAVPAFDTSGGDIALVKNWNGDAYHDITNLFDIVDLSDGTAIGNNKYFNLVVWGVANETGTFTPTVINLPSGQYTSQADAEHDVLGFDDFTIPREFLNDSSTGFLICILTIQHKNTTWEYKSTTDLRGTSPQTASGGAAGIVTSFADNQFDVFNVTDTSKVVALDVSGVSAATTRTLVVPDADGTIALEGAATDVGLYTKPFLLGGM